MHFQHLALSLAFGLCACDSGITVPSESVSAQTPPLDAAMPMERAAISDSGSAGSSAVAEPPSPSPLVCPSCKPNVAANALIDLSNCSTPGRPLDTALEQRFRTQELRAAATRNFSQKLTWGEITEELTLKNPSAETTIAGEISVDGDFVYSACDDSVWARVNIQLATSDGKLATTLRGTLDLHSHELGWPAGSSPVIRIFATDDLSSARGTLDLRADASKVQVGAMSFALVGTLDGVFGSLRIQLHEYPDEAAAQGDPLRPVEIYERFFAQFPHDHCEGRGRSAALAEPLPELAGATAQQLYAAAQMALAGAAPFDGTWLDGSPGRGSIELGAPLSEQVCVELRPREPWIVHYAGPAQARSEDRSLEVAQASFEVAARPYSRVIERVYSTGDLGNAAFSVRWPDGLDHATEGWIETVEPHGQLAWPPCTHAESCDPN